MDKSMTLTLPRLPRPSFTWRRSPSHSWESHPPSPSSPSSPRFHWPRSFRRPSSSGSVSSDGTVQSTMSAQSEKTSMSDDSTRAMLRSRTRSVSSEIDEPEYPTGVKLGLIILALCLSILVMSLDNNIIATAIPTITTDFSSLPDVGWYGSAYLLTTASLQLLFGKFYTFFSIKRVFLLSVGIFELGSLICGIAPNSMTLIAGRAVAGVGGAGIFTGAFTVLAYSVPLGKRAFYTGAISSIWGVSNVAGPLLGGFFTDKVSWRWCFFINIPIGVITMAVIFFLFPDPPRQKTVSVPILSRLKRTDPLGNLLFMPSIISLLLALQLPTTSATKETEETNHYSSPKFITLIVLSALLLIVFIYLQHRLQDDATVPPRIFLTRNVWASSLFSFSLGSSFILSLYFLPMWFQSAKYFSPLTSGLANLPLLIAIVLVSLAAGWVVSRWGHYAPFMLSGALLTTAGYALLSTLEVGSSAAKWALYQLLAGAGVGAGLQQPLIAVQLVLPLNDIPTATSIVIFLQTLGGAISLSVGQAVFSSRLATHIPTLTDLFDRPVKPAELLRAGAAKLAEDLDAGGKGVLARVYNDSITRTFIVCAGAAAGTVVASLLVEWRPVREADRRERPKMSEA